MGKYVFCSDVHLRDEPPRCYRSMSKQEWLDYQMSVAATIFSKAEDHGCDVIIAGDLFDKPEVSLNLIHSFCEQISAYSFPRLCACLGQHDVFNHVVSKTKGTAIGLLNTMGLVHFHAWPEISHFSWGEEIIKEAFPICAAHKTVWIRPPFPGADTAGNVQNFKNLGYDLMVFGDNHYPFITKVGKTTILNCGSCIKQSYFETHTPSCYLVDGINIHSFSLPCREFDEEEYSISHNTSIIENISSSDGSISFKKNVETLVETVQPSVGKKALSIVDRSEK